MKNSQWEQFRADDTYIWRGLDTSPGDGRYYWQREPGTDAARWCKRHMRVGETWTGPGHYVQFYDKATCQPVEVPWNGPATNNTRLVARHTSKTWNGITVPDVVELDGGPGSAERFFFARGYGLVAWEATWGSSAISEVNVAGDTPRAPLLMRRLTASHPDFARIRRSTALANLSGYSAVADAPNYVASRAMTTRRRWRRCGAGARSPAT